MIFTGHALYVFNMFHRQFKNISFLQFRVSCTLKIKKNTDIKMGDNNMMKK